MGVFAELWFLTVPAVLAAFVVFVILNSIFNPKPDPSAGHHARGPASTDTIGSSSSDSFYFIGDSVGSSAGSSDSTSSSPDFDSGSGSGGGGGEAGAGDSSGSSDSGGGSTSD